jgi:hypothetical protein
MISAVVGMMFPASFSFSFLGSSHFECSNSRVMDDVNTLVM